MRSARRGFSDPASRISATSDADRLRGKTVVSRTEGWMCITTRCPGAITYGLGVVTARP